MAVKKFCNAGHFFNLQRLNVLALVVLFCTFATFAQDPVPTQLPEDDPDQPIKIKTDLVTLTLVVY